MHWLVIAAVGLLSFANGANDNFKGVATLWGAGRSSYRRALAWATGFTLLGSLASLWLASGLAAKFNGSTLVAQAIFTQSPFLAAVVLAGAVTVLLASRLGLPVSTTHALAGALVGAGITAAGLPQVRLGVLAAGVVLPLVISPLLALGLTLAVYPLLARLATTRDCVCVDQAGTVQLAAEGADSTTLMAAAPAIRWAPLAACQTGTEAVRWSATDALHWLSGAGISFARGLNDTPKIAAVLFLAPTVAAGDALGQYLLVGLVMVLGGSLGTGRLARTLSKEITPMATEEAASANLVSAVLVTLASAFALPVSTTHVTCGGLFGIGWLRRGEANWGRVRQIVFSWIGTLPLGGALAWMFYRLFTLAN